LRKPSLAAALRAEVKRHSTVELKKARKRLRKLQKQVTELRRQAVGQGRVLASLKRRISGLRSGMRQAGAVSVRRSGPHMSPQAIRAVRDRMRMTREQFARLVGVSPGSIFGWESGRTQPRRGAVGRLGELRKTGVRAARAQVAGLRKGTRRGGRRRARRR
jgi:DNA-binding transcriptional regulator YiaG